MGCGWQLSLYLKRHCGRGNKKRGGLTTLSSGYFHNLNEIHIQAIPYIASQ